MDYLYLYEDVRQLYMRYRAIGRVSLWGSVVEGDDGWRASCAYPERLFLSKTDRYGRPADVDSICEGLAAYGISIEVLDDDAETDVGRAIRRAKRKGLRGRGANTTS